ncbi:penicillin-binding protein 2 [Lachnoclostridium pacaense]|uniref:peptidoglycan D,D-transpeptidase FtsI family protein n=1 Tax=Enterocloster hominis (ex Hitch et al. 2024) TaxID=1917870 RepID=UPI001D10D5E5|nr:penicillin-binding transpeptidase domain-containing protein [Lachnoclostridium pacaense]MCC2817021.1 penicillin-binding protein 2 [Lachnoclostridium pacaense]
MVSDKKNTSKKAAPNPKANNGILGITYLIVALFLGLAVYMGYFLQVRSEDVINNSYNARLDSFSDRIVRGKIMAGDGTVLAETQVDAEGNETRVYYYGSVFDHAVGYSTKGKTGIEALANFYLLTSHVNLLEQVGNELSGRKNPGDNVYTTLDAELQQAAYAALGDRKGVVIAMEPDTGKVLAMVSKPGYDPNTLLQDWDRLTGEDNGEGQLLNRATQGLYPPGSTFKIVTALEYMREHPGDYRDYQFDCSGVYENGDYRIKCYHSTAHGHQDFTLAFANSCNGAFSSLGLGLNLGGFRNTAKDLLFNSPLPITGLPYKQGSFNMEPGADTWEILQTSIGQGTTQITPMHNAMITAAIANGGTLMKPYFLDSVETAGGEEIKKFMPASYGSLMTAGEAAGLTELMRAVVTEGTGSAVRTDAYTVAAKTGSAEFETGKETHAWFTGFAPAESPRLVVTVLVEEGGSGGRVAAPIARQLFDIYMSR